MSNKNKFLNEAIQVEGATLIGTARGYDLFQITTFEAAEQFVSVNNANDHCGSRHFSNADTFNANITGNTKAYFFVLENTNRVVQAYVRYGNNTLRIPKDDGSSTLNVSWNFIFENADGMSSSTLDLNYKVPIYLLPDIQISDWRIVPEQNLLIQNILYDYDLIVSPFFGPNDNLDEYIMPEEGVSFLSANAFNAGVSVNTVVIPAIHSVTFNFNAFNGVENLEIDASEEECRDEDAWGPSYHIYGVQNIIYDANLSDEERTARQAERERIKAEREEAARLEAERIQREREEAERLEAERLQREKEEKERAALQNIRYKVEGKEVKILGVRKRVTDLVIPDTIDGKPVTSIGSYAFYDDDVLQTVEFPEHLKKIEQGAFALTNCVSYRQWGILERKGVLIGKYNK